MFNELSDLRLFVFVRYFIMFNTGLHRILSIENLNRKKLWELFSK